MTSKTTVNMRTCNRTHHITVSMRDDGDMDVEIVSDCPHVQEYARRLTLITLDDVTDFCTSKINAPEIRQPLSGTCLCPLGVLNAAWMECGMLSKTMCKRAHHNEIILDPDEQ